jgi:hypothetical protein
MYKIYLTIKKKRNLRRFSAVFLVMVVMELFCPVFCDEPSYAKQINQTKTQISSKVYDSDISREVSFSPREDCISDDGEEICNDECLCHSTVVPYLTVVNSKMSSRQKEITELQYGEPLINSLSPPFQPPKNS